MPLCPRGQAFHLRDGKLRLRSLFRVDIEQAAQAFEAERRAEMAAVETLDVRVRSDEVIGQPLKDVSGLVGHGVVVSRMLRDGQLQVPHDDIHLRLGDVLHLVGYLVLRLNYLTLCGVLAGSMTDPPALAFANSLSTTQAASLAYATVYPLVMCLRILAPQVLVLLLWAGA